MESQSKTIKLFKAAKELNIGTSTIVSFLVSEGFKVENKPTTILDQEMYSILLEEFSLENKLKKENDKAAFKLAESIEVLNTTEFALKLVAINLSNKEPYLDLGNCGLTSEYFAVGSRLDKQLKRCIHLKMLILSNEWTVWKSDGRFWVREESNNKGKPNYLSKIPAAIGFIKGLLKLICSGNSDVDWGIKNTDTISALDKLTYLDLRNNEIDNIRGLNQLTSLKTLFISRNKITSFDQLRKLNELSHLDIHSNQISSISKISTLSALEILDLHNNLIEKVEDFKLLNNLKELYLQVNLINDITGFEVLIEKEDDFYLKIDQNPFVKEYQLKLLSNENHLPFIKELLLRSNDSSLKSDVTYPAKILMFGNHYCGKSTLVNFLTGESETGSTHILRILNYYLFDQAKTILPDGIIFDFGGQDFYHGIYSAFVSEDALQIILFDANKDYNKRSIDSNGIPIINFNRRYWLRQKNYQEQGNRSNSPYILVQTFAETNVEEAPALNYDTYPGYKKSFFLSLSNDSNYIDPSDVELYDSGKMYFKAYLKSVLTKRQITINEPNWYINFLRYIFDKKGKNHQPTNLKDIYVHYKANDLSQDEIKESLIINLITLHRHGLILYYGNIDGLKDFVWLNPQRLVEYIQNDILNKTFVDNSKNYHGGIIPKVRFEEIVKDEKIILLLKIQKIIFLHTPTENINDNEYIIPNFLPLMNKDDNGLQLVTFGFDKPNFIIKFNDFIPFGFINQMICFYGKQPDTKKFWRNQLLFTFEKEVRVLIELDFESLKINVNFQRLIKCSYSEEHIIEYLFFSIISLY